MKYSHELNEKRIHRWIELVISCVFNVRLGMCVCMNVCYNGVIDDYANRCSFIWTNLSFSDASLKSPHLEKFVCVSSFISFHFTNVRLCLNVCMCVCESVAS